MLFRTCVRNACRHARLGSVQTGKLLLIGQRLEVVQTGRPHAGDARVTAAHTSRPSEQLWLHNTKLASFVWSTRTIKTSDCFCMDVEAIAM